LYTDDPIELFLKARQFWSNEKTFIIERNASAYCGSISVVVKCWYHESQHNDSQPNSKTALLSVAIVFTLCLHYDDFEYAVIILSVIMLRAIMLSVIILSFVILGVLLLCIILLCVIILSVVMLNIIITVSVWQPTGWTSATSSRY
jgi:hypothetical protein